MHTYCIVYYIYLLRYTCGFRIVWNTIPGTLGTIYTCYIIHVSLALCVMLKYGTYVYQVLLCSSCPYPLQGSMVYLAIHVPTHYTIYRICVIPKYMTKGFHPVYT